MMNQDFTEFFKTLKSLGYNREVDFTKRRLVTGEQQFPITVGEHTIMFSYYFIRYPTKEAYAYRIYELNQPIDQFAEFLKRLRMEEQNQVFYSGWNIEPGQIDINALSPLTKAKALWKWIPKYVSETISPDQPEFFRKITKEEGQVVSLYPAGFTNAPVMSRKRKDVRSQRSSLGKRYNFSEVDDYGYMYARLDSNFQPQPLF
jgi:hypothetical protein